MDDVNVFWGVATSSLTLLYKAFGFIKVNITFKLVVWFAIFELNCMWFIMVWME